MSRLWRLIPVAYLLPLAYLVWPIFWSPLDNRFYNFFHSKRAVEPWTDIVVVGIDERTRENALSRPVFPLSRHVHEHAEVARRLDVAGARAFVFDLALDEEIFDEPPVELAEAFRATGKAFLQMSLREERKGIFPGAAVMLRPFHVPHPLLLESSNGAYVADVQIDSDGYVRRFDRDERLARLGLLSLPERLSGFSIERNVPIEFPSLDRPIPIVSYADVLAGDEEALSRVAGRIAFIGLTDDPSTDHVTVPRLQDLGDGEQAFGLPGVAVLAAITETLIRGAPIRDARWSETLLWNIVWSIACVLLMPRRNPARAALTMIGVILAGLVATGYVHAKGDVVFPAGLLFGCIFLAGSHTLVTSYLETSKELLAEALENDRVRHELETARRTQERFLPDEIPTVEGIDVWGINVSSLVVSGDYYDVIDLGGSRPLVVAIADVSGKGLPAALLMSNVQAGLHCHVFQERFDIEQTIVNLNRLVHQNTDPGKFVTLFLAEVEKSTRRIRYVRAGHDEPILVSKDGDARLLDVGNFMLGFVPDAEFDVGEIELAEGDVLCMYTDGITEARSPEDEEFGVERLIEALREHRDESARAIGEALLAKVRAFSRLERQADDVTMVVLKAAS